MAKNDFQYAGWNSYTLQCGTITTLISSGDCTLQCGMRLSWQWIHQVAAPAVWHVALVWHAIEFAQTSAILEFYIWFPFPQITAVDMSFCTSLRNFIQIGPPSAEKNDVMSIFKMAHLSHLGLYGYNNGFFEKPSYAYITSDRSLTDTIALNCLPGSFWENRFFAFWR